MQISQWMILAATMYSMTSALQPADAASAADEKAQWQKTMLAPLNVEDNIVYKTVNGESLVMTVFRPKVKRYDRSPLMVFTHGGGWSKGNRFGILIPVFYQTLMQLSENGIACASVEYRLVRSNVSLGRDCVVDCIDSVRFLMKNAERFGIDSTRIGVWGESAGGHLCLMTALADARKYTGEQSLAGIVPSFRCIVTYYPAVSLVNPEIQQGAYYGKASGFSKILGGPWEEHRAEAEALSPVRLVAEQSPPMLIFHGNKDSILSISNSYFLKARADEAGASAELVIVNNAEHGLSTKGMTGPMSPSMSEVNKKAYEYIASKLIDTK